MGPCAFHVVTVLYRVCIEREVVNERVIVSSKFMNAEPTTSASPSPDVRSAIRELRNADTQQARRAVLDQLLRRAESGGICAESLLNCVLVLHRLPADVNSVQDGQIDLAAVVRDEFAELRSLPTSTCGYIFKNGDIAWCCRTCQTDDTCVLCEPCFSASDHEGHEVLFHRTRAGGCCDCGDLEAWKLEGCCPKHRGSCDNTCELPPTLAEAAQLVVDVVVQLIIIWAVGTRPSASLFGSILVLSRCVRRGDHPSGRAPILQPPRFSFT